MISNIAQISSHTLPTWGRHNPPPLTCALLSTKRPPSNRVWHPFADRGLSVLRARTRAIILGGSAHTTDQKTVRFHLECDLCPLRGYESESSRSGVIRSKLKYGETKFSLSVQSVTSTTYLHGIKSHERRGTGECVFRKSPLLLPALPNHFTVTLQALTPPTFSLQCTYRPSCASVQRLHLWQWHGKTNT